MNSHERSTTGGTEKRTILYALPDLTIGGTQIKVVRMVRAIDKGKFNPVVCCITEGGPLLDELERENIKVYFGNKKHKFDVRIIYRLLAIIRKENVDVVHNFLGGNIWGKLAGIIGGVPVIIGTEESLRYWQEWYDFLIARILAPFTDVVICNSNESRKVAALQTGITPEKFTVIYNSIDLERMEKIRADRENIVTSLGLPQDCRLVACLARLDPRKGHTYLIQSLKIIREDHPDLKIFLLLIGDGKERNAIHSLASRLGLLEYIRFMGFRADALQLLASCDLLILPSIEEGFGNTIIEAMALSIPVIGTRVGGIPEIIEDGLNGLLVESRRPRDLAEAIMKIVTNPEFSKKLILNGKSTVQRMFVDEIVIRQYEELYLKLLHRKFKR